MTFPADTVKIPAQCPRINLGFSPPSLWWEGKGARRQGSDIAPPPFTSTFSFRPFYAHAHFCGALFPLLRGQQSPKPTLFTILIRLAAFFSPHLHIPFVTHLTHIHLRLLVPHTSVLSGVFPNLGDLGLLRFPRISLSLRPSSLASSRIFVS